MTKFLGVYATLAAASSAGLIDQARAGGRVCRLSHDYQTMDAAQNDTISLGEFDWDTLLDPELSVVEFTDLGTSVTMDIGDATFPDALVAAQDVATAAGTCNLLKSVSIANRRKPLWEMLGHATIAAAKLVAARCELLATLEAANPVSGTVGWTIYGSPQ
jgi:hypothetical protein